MSSSESINPFRMKPGAWALVCGLLMMHASLLAWGAYRHSPTFDEPGLLVAGISHWQFGRFELYRVNPPLVRMVAALPVLAVGCNTDWSQFYESPGARAEFTIGEDFIAANGTRSLWLFTIARWACTPFSIIGGLFCFLWGRELFGQGAGLLTLTLWCFEPNIIAHGQLITSDVPATALGLAAGYYFWRWLKQPTWSRAIIAGLILGIAELMKFSLVIFYVIWPILWVIWNLADAEKRRSWREWWRQAIRLSTTLLLSLYILNLGYAFDGWFIRLRDYTFVSEAFAGSEKTGGTRNRFAESWLGNIPMPVPKQYLLGMDRQKSDLEKFGYPSYLRGEWKEGGWYYYYLYGLLVKLPHGIHLLFLLALAASLFVHRRSMIWRDELILLAPALVLLIVVSSETSFNHHLRYVLPSLGLLLIFTGKAVSLLTCSMRLGKLLVVASLLWTIVSSLGSYPHSLSYFNEIAGGPRNGHKHLLHSNIDWGQDLIYFKEWLGTHPEAKPLYLIYYGCFNPQDLGITCQLYPQRFFDYKNLSNRLSPGWYAISINYIEGDTWRVRQGEYEYFKSKHPNYIIGNTIYIFKI